MIHVKSGDAHFIMRIKESDFYGEVHSLFKRTMNIRCLDSGVLYTVACRDLDNAPNTLIADFTNIHVFDIKLNMRVSSSMHRLYIDDRMVLSVELTEQWVCKLPQFPVNYSKLKKNISVMKKYMHEFGQQGKRKRTEQLDHSFEKEVARLLQERSVVFVHELYAGREEKAVNAAQRLLGLGPGLTPSGDDFLVGFFGVIHLPGGPLHSHTTLCCKILNQAAQYTNEISLAALQQAANGRVRECIVTLIDDLAYGTSEQVLTSLFDVLRIGSSSGMDIAMGIYSGMQLCCK
ncbi:DUF2877 domain-containing protein [Paenibacillus yanchengensis]|uniref:DUF2877 domain-containing protein n=1 Tax=Paenibacillus yanchengensis TaxID=2035833 RepID=A0ABW4YMH3_9BACL